MRMQMRAVLVLALVVAGTFGVEVVYNGNGQAARFDFFHLQEVTATPQPLQVRSMDGSFRPRQRGRERGHDHQGDGA